jgi:ribosomal protein S18 acetylase RimI-like enzyme
LERFYYRILPYEGLIFGAVAYVDDCPAGFVVATHDAAGSLRAVLRRRWPALMWVMGTSVLLEPRRLAATWKVGRMLAQQGFAASCDADGEILSLGVLAAYRESRFVRQSGLRIATDLLESVIIQLRTRGTRSIRALVETDNTPAKFFYIGLGWTLERTGISSYGLSSVEFVCRT